MKIKPKNNDEQNVKNFMLLISTIVVIIVAIVMGTIFIRNEMHDFKNHMKSFEQTLITQAKFHLKASVDNIKNDIELEKQSILKNKKIRIKNQSIIAYNLSYSLYNATKNLNKDKQINLIKTALQNISNSEHDINYFMFDTKGNLRLNSSNHEKEGKSFIEFRDINEKRFVNAMINEKSQKQNNIDYFWYKPKSTKILKKITYTRHLSELGIIIGSGGFVQKYNQEIKNKIKNKIEQVKYDNNKYLFVYQIPSLNNIKNKSKLVIQKYIKSTDTEVNAINNLMDATNYKANDFLFYDDNKKLIYATYLKDLRYFIAVGIELNFINELVQNKKKIFLENMYDNIFNATIIIIIISLVFFMFSYLFTRKIANIFVKYKKDVLSTERKFKLLFNHSNDAFIISNLDEKNNAQIINWNETAVKVTMYGDKELLNKNIFNMFTNLEIDIILNNDNFFKTLELKTKYGDVKTIELNAVVYNYENNKLLFTSLRDITERTLLKKEKAEQENLLIYKTKMVAMGEMIGNIAHQWRQPLGQLSGLFFDIESAYKYKELNENYLKNRVNEANDVLEYMSKTIDDFRNFFDPNSIKAEFYVIDALLNTKKIVSSTLAYNEIILKISCDEKLKITSYKNELSQAILNIISNAKDILIERKIKSPNIELYVNKENHICIHDNGGGIKDEYIKKIFDPYFTTKYNKGTGIGLYMVKVIIENKIHGSISVENKGKGALFTIKGI